MGHRSTDVSSKPANNSFNVGPSPTSSSGSTIGYSQAQNAGSMIEGSQANVVLNLQRQNRLLLQSTLSSSGLAIDLGTRQPCRQCNVKDRLLPHSAPVSNPRAPETRILLWRSTAIFMRECTLRTLTHHVDMAFSKIPRQRARIKEWPNGLMNCKMHAQI